MSLAVNTNVSSLTAHRSLAKNETMMNQAMTDCPQDFLSTALLTMQQGLLSLSA